ncbi:methyl-accepting chemotaxis protein [Phenylobacterium sp.]|uniref:methyl-accepting chemotaxis protein n=1 Tax=Phenylobacterium sp. TaxID=1871053 RepID=UPI002731E1B2|nr:methyl-accepting chemotaxis protein [Phenylobacterium sp.]MDP1618097.1 methyl-accepting chemotaxis protein [Phenylobacterium sp.]MDP1988702.1 methyl-accepting chemotaxis protein [Phenylobacterium sp.]
MLKTIRSKVVVAGLAVLVLSGANSGLGLWTTTDLTDALGGSSRSAEILRNHMQADMMHDALRADVLSAILAGDPSAGVDLDSVSAETAEHVGSFKQAMAANRSLASDGRIRESLDAVEQPLEAYILSAQQIVALAAQDPEAARAALGSFKQSFTDLEGRMEAVSDDIETSAAEEKARADQGARLSRTLMIGALVFSLLFSLGLIAASLGIIVRPIRTLASEMRALASGRTDVDLTSAHRHDEIGTVGKAVGDLQTLLAERAREEAAEAERRRDDDDARRAKSQEAADIAAREQAIVVGALAEGLDHLTRGDLTYSLTQAFPGEYEKLKDDFNTAIGQLRETITTVVANVSNIRSGSGEISQAADDLSRRTEQQAASLEETAAALDEITATVNRTASGARQAADTVQAAKSDAETGGQVVRDAVDAMGAIEKSAQEISQIIGVIDEIAFQTNLLALNAGVEAARAGDAGRGFAVVAQEVRALAQRSADAAKEIKQLISSSTNQVNTGVKLVDQTGEALQRIVVQVAEIDHLVSEIATSAQEQATGLQEVNTAVNQMDQVTQQNAAMVEQSTAASHALSQEAQTLASSVSRFQIGAGHPIDQATKSLPQTRSGPVAALRTVGRGGAAPKPASSRPDESWEEF